ncbi:MAG: FliH/SctL family protein [Bdellovibrionota bacterium]
MGILKGKLIKKEDEKALKILDIQAFPWLNFKEKDIVFPDNPRRNVILTKYHDPKEMREKITDATQFSQLLEKKTTPLYPVDLTADYERGVKELIKRKRRRLMGEEEAMALELAEIDASHQIQFKAKPAPRFDTRTTQQRGSVETEKKVEPAPLEKQEENSKEIKEEVIDKIIEKVTEKVMEKTQFINEQPRVMSEEAIIKLDDEEPIVEPQVDVVEIQKQAFEKGYLEGFQSGEERGMKAQESKYESVFHNIATVIEQIEKLKDSLYEESKDVFIEIIKLCSEKILREQIKFSDKSLFALFDEVTKSLSEKATMKVELNAQDLIRLKSHIEQLGMQNRVVLKEDANKQSGDFNIESDKGISIAGLQKTVENLVEKLKQELFSDDEHMKVG